MEVVYKEEQGVTKEFRSIGAHGKLRMRRAKSRVGGKGKEDGGGERKYKMGMYRVMLYKSKVDEQKYEAEDGVAHSCMTDFDTCRERKK